MKFLQGIMQTYAPFVKAQKALEENKLPFVMTGLSDVHKAVVISCFVKALNKRIAIITEDDASANAILDDLTALSVKAVYFPTRDYSIGAYVSSSHEYESKRIDTLSAVANGDFEVVLIPVTAAMSLTLPKEKLLNATFRINKGETLDLEKTAERLCGAGYTRTDMVDGTSQFSIHGGILDIFPTDAKTPFRIELFGDEVDTVSTFNIDTQLREEQISGFSIAPASEVLVKDKDLVDILSEYLKSEKKLSLNQKKVLNGDIELLESGLFTQYDRYMPFIYKEVTTVLDYLEDAVLVLSESANISEHIKNDAIRFSEDITYLIEQGFVFYKKENFYINDFAFFEKTKNSVTMDMFPRGSYPYAQKEIVNFGIKRSSAWSGDISVLKDDISYLLENKGSVVITAGEEKGARLLSEQLQSYGFKSVFLKNPEEVIKGITVTVGSLSSGFEINEINFALITVRHINGEGYKRKKYKRSDNSKEVGTLDELKNGDYVVHAAHGIGIFCGIQSITNKGVVKDYIKIRYAMQDVLYVPVTQLDLVSKYIGSAESEGIKLHRLGGTDWNKTRTRVKKAVKDMAKSLTALYAKRMSIKGYAFMEDDDLQNNFERRFPYEETDDQLRCSEEIKRDMQRAVPMDRLLCGDVGFGKTEVALRAAFKCISQGKQCAILVPTTILAWQHYNTIISRFGDLPLEISLLSRFETKAGQLKTVKGLKDGTVDMVVGTHRLISKDVVFKDLGLLIIDEEQRFGVSQKERLKEIYPAVDVLTLSATPIPRTLNMALSGLRDMSSIDEAPGDRHPVQTYVCEQNNGLLLDAIKKELGRGGQVYYLHNRVEDISRTAVRLKEKLPDANIDIAHGRMGDYELSRVWKRLLEHQIDILVCTTIIETGVDVPNVNTLIIEDADRMGLSQLHQLRGRVGRSPRRAYAYFCFRAGRVLKEDAQKRLEAIRQFTEFGSGYKIAMRDLEIRGAGSVLGGEQHGNMEAVGYDMYLKLLNDAIKEEKGEPPKDDNICTVDLNISAHIPERYIPSLSARLNMYKRIAAIISEEDKSNVIDELCDRFGEPPKAVLGLIDVSMLRSKANSKGIYEISGDAKQVVLRLNSFDGELFGKLGNAFPSRVKLLAEKNTAISVSLTAGQNTASLIHEIINVL